ncbi:MAG: hypothetical protein IJP80_00850 [Bacteroidales bacterium]|nr:hypothetical protein [Bacteroidales bacterium]
MKRTLIFGLLGLLLVAGAAAWKFMPRVLAYDECSPVYRHFADMQLEGVRVTYIKDKQVNDTLRLPVTLLEAESDRGWELLDSLFGYTENQMKLLNDPDLPDNVKKTLLDNWPSFECHRAHRETPEQVVEPPQRPPRRCHRLPLPLPAKRQHLRSQKRRHLQRRIICRRG